jgi:hypothetical protein
MKYGCCLDKVCTRDTCMELPIGKTCSNCFHEKRCVSMFGAKSENKYCGWFPRRFAEKKIGTDTKSE